MLQTLIWRTGRIAPPQIAPAAWWRHWSALLPPRIGVLVGMLALLCGGLLAAAEYAEHRAELRLAETNRLLEEFRSGPVADAWGRLRTAWRAEQNRQNALLARIPSLARPRPRAHPAPPPNVRAGDHRGIPAAGRHRGGASVPDPACRLRAYGQLRCRRSRGTAGAGAVDVPRPAPILLRVRVFRGRSRPGH